MTPPNDSGSLGHVVIGAQEIYNLCVVLREQSNETRNDIRSLQRTLDQVVEDLKDHETRLRAVERRAWAIPSASTAIALVALLVSAYVAFN